MATKPARPSSARLRAALGLLSALEDYVADARKLSREELRVHLRMVKRLLTSAGSPAGDEGRPEGEAETKPKEEEVEG